MCKGMKRKLWKKRSLNSETLRFFLCRQFRKIARFECLKDLVWIFIIHQLCRGLLKLSRMLKIAQIGVHLGLQNVKIQKRPEAQRELELVSYFGFWSSCELMWTLSTSRPSLELFWTWYWRCLRLVQVQVWLGSAFGKKPKSYKPNIGLFT